MEPAGEQYQFGMCTYDGGKTGTPGWAVTDWTITSFDGPISRVSFTPIYDDFLTYEYAPVTLYPSPYSTASGQFEEYVGQGSHYVQVNGTVYLPGGDGSFGAFNDFYIASN